MKDIECDDEEDSGPLGDILVQLKDLHFDDNLTETPHQEFKKELERHLEDFRLAVNKVIQMQRRIGLVVSESEDILEISKRLKDYPKIAEAVSEYVEGLDIGGLTERYREAVTEVSQYQDLFRGLRNVERFMCSVCLESTVDTFLDPCGHTVCGLCSERINKKCPYCRTVVFKARRMIFS